MNELKLYFCNDLSDLEHIGIDEEEFFGSNRLVNLEAYQALEKKVKEYDKLLKSLTMDYGICNVEDVIGRYKIIKRKEAGK